METVFKNLKYKDFFMKVLENDYRSEFFDKSGNAITIGQKKIFSVVRISEIWFRNGLVRYSMKLLPIVIAESKVVYGIIVCY